VECIGKGKASAPYEFGTKASITTNNRAIERAYVDKGYRGHDAKHPRRVFTQLAFT
jgi:IS5 family transposase